jgi:PTH1 family peptidyl-tRNA hydrolase
MKLVAGLGNPGSRYEGTRHNLGFRVVDVLAGRWRIEVTRQKFSAWVGDGTVAGQRTMLLKPTTFMNLSGQAVQAAVAFHKLPLEDLLIVSDDLDLPAGALRVRASGSSGGHRGLESIIQLLGSEAFARIRIGIGRADRDDAVSHVLGGFAPDEEAIVEAAVRRAADAVECWLTEGVAAAMNRFNFSVDRTERPKDGAGPGKSDKGVAS